MHASDKCVFRIFHTLKVHIRKDILMSPYSECKFDCHEIYLNLHIHFPVRKQKQLFRAMETLSASRAIFC